MNVLIQQPSFNEKITLHENISIPSRVHVYSLGVEYMRDWFFRKGRYEDNFFKTVYVNGKHIFDDFRRFNRTQLTKIEKPALAIIPNVDYEYNREFVDLRLGGFDVLTRRSRYGRTPIIQDIDHNFFLSMVMDLVKMNFTFKIRIGTKPLQDELFNHMNFAYRIGSTQKEFVSYDFHLPYEAMLNMAAHTGFEIMYPSEKDKGKIKPKVKNISGFLSYLNSYSMYPISYKMRTLTGNPEFFIRMPDVCTHISCLDPLERDDGEREEQLDNNFHIEMRAVLTIPAPQQYFFYSSERLEEQFKLKNEIAGLYSIRSLVPPPKDENGWAEYISTEYVDETNKIEEINLTELLEGSDLYKVILNSIQMGISPSIFMNIKIFNAYHEKDFVMDWESLTMKFPDPKMIYDYSQLSVYIDKEYVNNQLLIINQSDLRQVTDKPKDTTFDCNVELLRKDN